MSTWEFRVATKLMKCGNTFSKVYGVIEVYYDDEGEVEFHGDFKDPNGWDNLEDLHITLERMQSATSKPVIGHLNMDGELELA